MSEINILKSIEFILNNSKYVEINKLAIKSFCNNTNWNNSKHWTHFSPVNLSKLNKEQKIAFIFIFNSLSFSYWGKPKWKHYQDKSNRGTFSMLTALKNAIDNKTPILDPNYLSKITKKEFKQILKGNTEIPLLNERLQILHKLGSTIVSKYNNKFNNIIKKQKDAIELLTEIINNFKSFDDKTKYKSKNIHFYKRAQLLVSDLNEILNLKLKNVDKLTACADYILPMVLRHYNILEYSKSLANKVDKNIIIKKDSLEEIEIRANTIHAVELIKTELKKRKINLTSMQINDYLWTIGNIIPETEQYHLARTTWY